MNRAVDLDHADGRSDELPIGLIVWRKEIQALLDIARLHGLGQAVNARFDALCLGDDEVVGKQNGGSRQKKDGRSHNLASTPLQNPLPE